MKQEDFSKFKKRLSKVNKLRRLFWAELRNTRDEFLTKYPGLDFKDNNQWQEIMCSLNDMWESTIKEELRREMKLPRQDQPLRPPGGLYVSNRLCVVCGLPLIGRQKLYCSQECTNINKIRRFRQQHPDKYQEHQYKYLKECVTLSAQEKESK